MKKTLRRGRGFTLIEMMIVVVIIGLLAAIVIPDLIEMQKQAQIETCKASLRGVQAALELYSTHLKTYPEKLESLIKEGYLSEGSTVDPWRRDFVYRGKQDGVEGEGDGDSTVMTNYALGSAGPDKSLGTKDDIDAPINPNRHSIKDTSDDQKDQQ